MKFIYPAVFRKNEEGRYKAFFPDLACCEAEGDTLDDAIDNANEAAYNWIYAEVMEDEMDLPAISDESDLDLLEGDIVRNIQVNIRMYDGWEKKFREILDKINLDTTSDEKFIKYNTKRLQEGVAVIEPQKFLKLLADDPRSIMSHLYGTETYILREYEVN